MSTILLIGEDELLLRTRDAVLRTIGVATVTASSASALAIQTKLPCDLIIFCHSVPAQVAAALSETIRARWPGTPILRMTSLRTWESPDPNGVAESIASADPERLVKRTAELLGTPYTSRSRAITT